MENVDVELYLKVLHSDLKELNSILREIASKM
jgi:hypothetical protein